MTNRLQVANLNCSNSNLDVNETLVCDIDFNLQCPIDVVAVDIMFENHKKSQSFGPASNKMIVLCNKFN